MRKERDQDRAVTPAIATILIVAIVVILSAVAATQFLGLTSKIGGPTAQATFEYDESAVGVEMTPEQIAQDVTVEINGKQVESFDKDDAGNGKLIPTSPGDELTVVAADGSRSVLVSKTIDDRDEIGDFISHYTFEGESGDDTLEDQSGNGNEGYLQNDPEWKGGSLAFDASENQYVSVTDISSPRKVEEFTIAVTYKTDTGDQKQELVEHIEPDGDNWGLELKTGPGDPDKYEPYYFADEQGGAQGGQISGGEQDINQKQVLVGTYDGSQTEFFVDGESKSTRNFDSEINMGNMNIARDAEGGFDYLEGEIYEVRLYYSAFDDGEVKSITKAME